MRRSGSIAALAAVVAALAGALVPAGAAARSYAPPDGQTMFGVSDTGDVRGYTRFAHEVGAHPAVVQAFHAWGTDPSEALARWKKLHTRGMLSISTTGCWLCDDKVGANSIVAAENDSYILRLNKEIAAAHQTVYVRLMPEMNGSWNPYSAFDAAGVLRSPHSSTDWFKAAWKRFAVIVRGGSVAQINKALERLHQPPLLGIDNPVNYAARGVPKMLPRPHVAMAWVPMMNGSPAVPGNQPSAYWPGPKYVDWVGTDLYAGSANFGDLTRFYDAYEDKPFMIGEFSPAPSGSPSFVRKLFAWAEHHERAKLLVYYQGFTSDDVNRISKYPAAESALRKLLDSPKIVTASRGH